jgi:hypothetical protein
MDLYRYFAFVDLLGYRDAIERDLLSGKADLKDRLTEAFDALKSINEADVGIKAISDSIFVSLNNTGLGFSYFASVLQSLQRTFLYNGLLLRGGVAFAAHFENSKVTYSPALVEAYRLESQRAFFPRILIHENVIEKLRNEDQFDAALRSNAIVSHAGNYQIHFLTRQTWGRCYQKLRELADKDARNIREDPRIYAKHWYLQEYVREFKASGSRFRRYLPSWD